MELLSYLFIFYAGTILGSFLNVCSYRMPRDLSVIKPRSFCPNCKKQIAWYENVPIFSFIFLRAKCSGCSTSIPVRYFFTEVMEGVILVLFWAKFGFSMQFVCGIVFLSMLLVVIVSDFETGLIPDKITLPGIVIGLIFSVLNPELFSSPVWYHRLFESFLGVLAGGALLYVTGMLGELAFKKESMGGGDIKLLAMMGAYIGVTKVFFVFMLAPFIALPFALWQRICKKEETIPYGPFLAVFGVLFFIHGNLILTFISKLYGV